MAKVFGKKRLVEVSSDINALQLAEKIAEETLDEARKAYDAQYERALKFVTLLASGAGAGTIFLMGKLETNGLPRQFWPLAVFLFWWFAIASYVLLFGAASRQLSAGTSGAAIRDTFLANVETHGKESDALWHTRWSQNASVTKQIDEYALATSARARAISRGYKAFVASPLVGLTAFLAVFIRF